ncbi:YkvA family protein [Neptuniibacter sp. QD48_11]|uniref:YkvA family protein n=1 Tax=Neptuniibacter sp. QD48_11 TaxID=3398211 RepID=UPI0039F46138
MSDLSIDELLCKLKQIKGAKGLLYKATLLYVLITDADVPAKTKAIIVAALVYLVNPLDTVPDVAPVIGLLDDLAVITAALKAISSQVRAHHESQANSLINEN